jgi:wyosine [tRNA(Phe)-imidazoG37] synthetase (radical SAM superfamily)
MLADRGTMYSAEDVIGQVKDKVARIRELGEPIDYLTFVSDGEPTLDRNLGREILGLKPLGTRIAVISNASLITREDVRSDLSEADWVSLKVDTVDRRIWRKLNRPHRELDLDAILRGMLEFSRMFQGTLVSETMLVRDLNDTVKSIRAVVSFLGELAPAKAYLAIPIRPPAEANVRPPTEASLNRAFQMLRERLDFVEHLIGYEGNAFASTGDAEEDLLSTTAVHPMKKEAVEALLERTGSSWAVVRELVDRGALVETTYGKDVFYVKCLAGH